MKGIYFSGRGWLQDSVGCSRLGPIVAVISVWVLLVAPEVVAGEVDWAFRTGGAIQSSPVLGPDGTIYIGSYDRKLHALTPAGTEKWSFTMVTPGFTGIYSSPAVGPDGTVYFGGEDGRLYALNPETGTTNWIYTVTGADDKKDPTSIYSDIAVGGDGTVYFGSYSANVNFCYLYALTNGVLRWRYAPGRAIFSEPIVGSDGAVFFGCDNARLYALNPNGTLRWSLLTGAKAITASPALDPEGKVYVGVGSMFNTTFYCANTNGTTNWTFTAAGAINSAAAIADDGTIYFGSNASNLYALNPSGTLKWVAHTAGAVRSSPALGADGMIYVGCDDKKVYAFDSTGSNVWSVTVSNKVFASPALAANGTIYVGSDDRNLYAITGSAGPARAPWAQYRHDAQHTAQYVPITNTAPVISPIPDQLSAMNLVIDPVPFTVSDGETLAQNLVVTATSTNTTLVPDTQLTFSGAGSNRFLTITTAANEIGTNLITVTVTDWAGMTNSTVFVLTILPPNIDPELNPIADAVVNELETVTLQATASDSNDPPQELTFSVASGPSNAVVDPMTGVFTWTPIEAQGPSTNLIELAVTDNGFPRLSATQSFTVVVHEVNLPPSIAPPGIRFATPLFPLTFAVLAHDADLPAQPLTFALGPDTPPGATIDPVTGVFSWTPTLAQGPATNEITVMVNDGWDPPLSATQPLTVIITETNRAPLLEPIGDATVTEHETLTVTNTAADMDWPTQSLTFSLGTNAPAGASIDPATGRLSWTPSETQGPAVSEITVLVTDDGFPPLSASQTFDVTVLETNATPALKAIPDIFVPRGLSAWHTNLATDSDWPAQSLTFTLQGEVPAGCAIDPVTGILNCSPPLETPPGTNVVTITVSDDGAPALASSRTFTIFVLETNRAPLLESSPDLTLVEGELLVITNLVTDADWPPQRLTFSLEDEVPEGAQIDTASGVFSWMPSETQGPGTNVVTIRVSDDGSPPLSSWQTFTVTVLESNSPPVIAQVPELRVIRGQSLSYTHTASDPDYPAQQLSFAVGTNAPPDSAIHPDTGLFNWTPPLEFGPGTNWITLEVTDNGIPPLTSTSLFVVIVLETNRAPVPAAVPEQLLHARMTLMYTNTATDPDGWQTVAYSLGPGAPDGATLDAITGVFRWTPDDSDVGTNSFEVRVTDNGAPSLMSGTTMQVTVFPRPAQTITVTNGAVLLSWNSIPGRNYRAQATADPASGDWMDLSPVVEATAFTASIPEPATESPRYYRILVLP